MGQETGGGARGTLLPKHVACVFWGPLITLVIYSVMGRATERGPQFLVSPMSSQHRKKDW